MQPGHADGLEEGVIHADGKGDHAQRRVKNLYLIVAGQAPLLLDDEEVGFLLGADQSSVGTIEVANIVEVSPLIGQENAPGHDVDPKPLSQG